MLCGGHHNAIGRSEEAMQSIIETLIRKRIANCDEILGCSEEEIKELEAFFNTHLPSEYRNFLLTMGHSAGKFFVGTDIFYPSLFHLKLWAKDLLMENNVSFQLPDDAFVFSMHQGYTFLYFNLSEGEDPPVYMYLEGDESLRQVAPTFSEYLAETVSNDPALGA